MGATGHLSELALHTVLPVPDANDPGLLSSAQASLLTDQYELAMAAGYLRRDMNKPAESGRSPTSARWASDPSSSRPEVE